MKRAGLCCLAVVPGLATLWIAAAAAAERDKPNIILCMTDDQGWGDTGYNGHPELKTPNLDTIGRRRHPLRPFLRSQPFMLSHPRGGPASTYRPGLLTAASGPTRIHITVTA